MPPLFITFEGGEGCGKSYQAKTLYRRLVNECVPAVLTHEPGGTVLGENITRWLKWRKDVDLSAVGELLLFSVSRNQLVHEIIDPALAEGKVVICDRFYDSTTVYQGYGRGIDLDTIKKLNALSTGGLKPKLTFLLDMSSEYGLARKKDNKKDRFETEEIEFHEQIRQGYLQLARNEPRRFFVVDAMLSKNNIAAIIWKRVERLITAR